MTILTVPTGKHTRRVISIRREPRSDKLLPLEISNLLAVSFVHTCLDEIIASFFQGLRQFCHKIWQIRLRCIVPAMLIHFGTARRRQWSQSQIMRTRASAFRHLCKGPRADRAALSPSEWSLPTAGACPFDVVVVLVCDLFCL